MATNCNIITVILRFHYSDVTAALKSEKAEILRLENEKKDWISHGVSAEFEKKNKVCLYVILVKSM